MWKVSVAHGGSLRCQIDASADVCMHCKRHRGQRSPGEYKPQWRSDGREVCQYWDGRWRGKKAGGKWGQGGVELFLILEYPEGATAEFSSSVAARSQRNSCNLYFLPSAPPSARTASSSFLRDAWQRPKQRAPVSGVCSSCSVFNIQGVLGCQTTYAHGFHPRRKKKNRPEYHVIM